MDGKHRQRKTAAVFLRSRGGPMMLQCSSFFAFAATSSQVASAAWLLFAKLTSSMRPRQASGH
jgi:hypothetical protein